MLMSPNYT